MSFIPNQLAGAVAERVDRAFVHLAFRSRRASERGLSETSQERMDEAARFYPEAEREGRLFAAPPPAALRERHVRRLPDGEAVDLHWPSRYEPLHATYRLFHDAYPKNSVAAARWLRHRRSTSVVISLHGWGGGSFRIGEINPVVRSLYRAGADVVMPALPHHGVRASARLARPKFPSTDPMRSNEGFAQGVSDLRALILALRERGMRRIAVAGRSLGGFTTALLATVEPTLDAAIPIIPFGSLPELMWEQGEGTPARQRAAETGVTFERFAAAFTATTPLRRKPVIEADRIFIVAGERDRVTPMRHALKLRAHFTDTLGAPVRLETFAGGHLIQAGRGPAMRALREFLAERAFFTS
jgi:dienelactone hydrolase